MAKYLRIERDGGDALQLSSLEDDELLQAVADEQFDVYRFDMSKGVFEVLSVEATEDEDSGETGFEQTWVTA